MVDTSEAKCSLPCYSKIGTILLNDPMEKMIY